MFHTPSLENPTPSPKVTVIGIGGAGGNAINALIRRKTTGVDFIVANTDAHALAGSLAPVRILLGQHLTGGRGAGSNPQVGYEATLASRGEISKYLSGSDLVFIASGMGGGTGTFGASVIADINKDPDILTVAVVTTPISFEGGRRRKQADLGIARLQQYVDALVIVSNQRLIENSTSNLTVTNALAMTDDVLVNSIRSISDIINIPGTINIDFADIKKVMKNAGYVLMGIGFSTGRSRAYDATKMALSSPTQNDLQIDGAHGILINIAGSSSISMGEVQEICSLVYELAHDDAFIKFGTIIDQDLGDQLRVTLIATDFFPKHV